VRTLGRRGSSRNVCTGCQLQLGSSSTSSYRVASHSPLRWPKHRQQRFAAGGEGFRVSAPESKHRHQICGNVHSQNSKRNIVAAILQDLVQRHFAVLAGGRFSAQSRGACRQAAHHRVISSFSVDKNRDTSARVLSPESQQLSSRTENGVAAAASWMYHRILDGLEQPLAGG
jgi:hypothetical protein